MDFKTDKTNQDSLKFGCLSNIIYILLCVKVAVDIFWGNVFIPVNIGVSALCLVCVVYLNYKKKAVLNTDIDNIGMARLTFEAVLLIVGVVMVCFYIRPNKLNLMFAFPVAFAIIPSTESTRLLNILEDRVKVKTKKRVVLERVLYALAWVYFIYYAVMLYIYNS